MGLSPGASAAAGAAAQQLLLLRPFADDSSSSGKPEGEEEAAGGGAAEAGGSPADPSALDVDAAEAGGDDVEWEVPLEELSRRQRAWVGAGEPGRYKHFLPRLSRKELGAFGEVAMAEEFDEEAELYPTVPPVPLYDLQTVIPEIAQPQTPLYDRLRALKEGDPDMGPDELAEAAGCATEPPPPPFPGAEQILDWELQLVMVVGVNESHPANAKAKCRLYLRDLQRQCGLTDAALQHIAAVCGPRYNPNDGRLTLVSKRYPHREENRRHIVRIIKALVEEGHRKHPAEQQERRGQEGQAAAAAAAP